jgi:hypothetical protein
MTKTQGWVIIILLFVVVAMFMSRNVNDAKESQNKVNACMNNCNANIILKTNEDIPVLQSCVNKCATDNGGTPIFKP